MSNFYWVTTTTWAYLNSYIERSLSDRRKMHIMNEETEKTLCGIPEYRVEDDWGEDIEKDVLLSEPYSPAILEYRCVKCVRSWNKTIRIKNNE